MSKQQRRTKLEVAEAAIKGQLQKGSKAYPVLAFARIRQSLETEGPGSLAGLAQLQLLEYRHSEHHILAQRLFADSNGQSLLANLSRWSSQLGQETRKSAHARQFP